MKSLAAGEPLRRSRAPGCPVASLMPTIRGMLRDRRQRFDRDVGHRPRRDVVDDDRQRRFFRDGGKVRGKPVLARLVVIRNDDAAPRWRRHRRRRGPSRSRPRSNSCRIRQSPAPARWRPRRSGDDMAMLLAAQRRDLRRSCRTAPARCSLPRSASRPARRMCPRRHGHRKMASQAPESSRKT